MQLGSNPGRSCRKQPLHFFAQFFFNMPRISSTIFCNYAWLGLLFTFSNGHSSSFSSFLVLSFPLLPNWQKHLVGWLGGSNPCPPTSVNTITPAPLGRPTWNCLETWLRYFWRKVSVVVPQQSSFNQLMPQQYSALAFLHDTRKQASFSWACLPTSLTSLNQTCWSSICCLWANLTYLLFKDGRAKWGTITARWRYWPWMIS